MKKKLKILAVIILFIFMTLQVVCPASASEINKLSDKPLEIYKTIQNESGIITILSVVGGIVIAIFGMIIYRITKSFGYQVMFIGIAIVICSLLNYYVLNTLGPKLLNTI